MYNRRGNQRLALQCVSHLPRNTLCDVQGPTKWLLQAGSKQTLHSKIKNPCSPPVLVKTSHAPCLSAHKWVAARKPAFSALTMYGPSGYDGHVSPKAGVWLLLSLAARDVHIFPDLKPLEVGCITGGALSRNDCSKNPQNLFVNPLGPLFGLRLWTRSADADRMYCLFVGWWGRQRCVIRLQERCCRACVWG